MLLSYNTCILLFRIIKENDRLRQDMVTMEKAVTERMGYLQRHKVHLYISTHFTVVNILIIVFSVYRRHHRSN